MVVCLRCYMVHPKVSLCNAIRHDRVRRSFKARVVTWNLYAWSCASRVFFFFFALFLLYLLVGCFWFFFSSFCFWTQILSTTNIYIYVVVSCDITWHLTCSNENKIQRKNFTILFGFKLFLSEFYYAITQVVLVR